MSLTKQQALELFNSDDLIGIGMALYRFTPFTRPEALLISLIIAIMGFFGGIVMSAVKRDVGIKDFGHLIQGHGGMLDRLDSLLFAVIVVYVFAQIIGR